MEKHPVPNSTSRRRFLGTLTTGAAALSMGSMLAPIQQLQAAPEPKAGISGNKDPDEWFKQIKSIHTAVIVSPAPGAGIQMAILAVHTIRKFQHSALRSQVKRCIGDQVTPVQDQPTILYSIQLCNIRRLPFEVRFEMGSNPAVLINILFVAAEGYDQNADENKRKHNKRKKPVWSNGEHPEIINRRNNSHSRVPAYVLLP